MTAKSLPRSVNVNPHPTVDPAGPVSAPSVGSSVSDIASGRARLAEEIAQRIASIMVRIVFIDHFLYSLNVLLILVAAGHVPGADPSIRRVIEFRGEARCCRAAGEVNRDSGDPRL